MDRDGNYQQYTVRKWLLEGSEDEDALTACRASNHFHNPVHSGDWTQSQMSDSLLVDIRCGTSRYSNVTWGTGFTFPSQGPVARTGQEMGWDNARTYFYEALTSAVPAVREDRFVKTFKAMGQVMHLLQDMAVPAHVRNDMSSHLRNSKEWGKNPFELYVVSHTAGIGAGPVKPEFVSPFRHTDFWDTNSYTGENPSSGLNQGLSEYVNANYVSDNTIFEPASDTKHYFKYPNESTSVQIITKQIQDRFDTSKTIPRKYYWKSGDGDSGYLLAGYGCLTAMSSTPRPPYVLFPMDDYVHADYAARLLPRAVGYSAALLDYFFRGKIDLSLPARGVYTLASPTDSFKEIRVKAKNTTASGEEMTDGQIQLVVHYNLALSDPFQSESVDVGPDTYIVVAEKNNAASIPRNTTTELVFDLSANPIPLWATNVTIQVVFKGQLGNEANALAIGFRDISEPTPIDIVNNMDHVCVSGNYMLAGSMDAINTVDFNHDGKADFDVFPHDLNNVYLAFNGYYASSSNYSATFASIPHGQYGRVFVLSDYGTETTPYPLIVSGAATLANVDPLDSNCDRYVSPWGDYTYPVENDDEYYPLMNVERGLKNWWAPTYENMGYPPNGTTCDSTYAQPDVTGPVAVTLH